MTTGKRLLVVDDEQDFAEFVVDVAARLGYVAAWASNVRDFQALFIAHRPDIVVLDVVMPEIDGIELVQWLMANGYRSKIVIVSGYGTLYADAAKAIAETCGSPDVTILAKPVTLGVLRAALSESASNGQAMPDAR